MSLEGVQHPPHWLEVACLDTGFGIFTIFGQGANSVGTMEAGFVASLLGAPRAMLLGGGIGAAVTLAFWMGWPILRGFRTEAGPEEAQERIAY